MDRKERVGIIDYRVVSGTACYWIQIDRGIIVDAAPIAKAWIGVSLNRFQRAFPRASIKVLDGTGKTEVVRQDR
jgi:hypothetical protein